MSVIKAFRAIRPTVENVAAVSCVPYDVIYESEARELIEQNPLSFLRVTLPKAAGENLSAEAANAIAKSNLRQMLDEGILIKETGEAIYIYRLTLNGNNQTGIIAACSVDEYDTDKIKKHEKTRPDKVEDRTEHMLAVGAQTGLIFLAFRNTETIRALIAAAVEKTPLYDLAGADGIRHTVWQITDAKDFIAAFEKLPNLYIADGHHRAESASLARKKRKSANPAHNGSEEYNFVMAGVFPADDLNIMAYNRVVLDLNGHTTEGLLTAIGEQFGISETTDPTPNERGSFCMYLAGKWYLLKYQGIGNTNAIDSLDVSILQTHILNPLLNIDDPRTNERVKFVGGARGTAALAKMVDSGEAAAAFSMFPTSMDDLFAVADINEIMPPKSTWFEPKLKDGLVIHQI